MRDLLLALLLIATTPAAAEESWATRRDADSRWRPVDVRSTWNAQGYQGYDGVVWFRGTIAVPGLSDPALFLGPPAYGSYDVYAAGRLIGRSRGSAATLPFGFYEVFRVPREAVRADGTVDIALRVRRIGWVSDDNAGSGPVSGELLAGDYRALADRLHAGWSRRLIAEVPLLVLAALFVFVALHHLLLFGRRRAQSAHLWFGLLALAFAANTFASTYWIYELTASRAAAVRITDATGHLAAVFAVQFLCSFFARRPSRLLRAYQLSHLAIASLVALWPQLRPIFATAAARWLWLVPLLVWAAAIVLREARRDAEARIIAVAGAIMIGIQAAELARNVTGVAWPFDFSIAAFGFGAAIVAMSLALSLRFRRVHDELDRLRLHLEDEVDVRTRDLAVARDEAQAADRAKGEFLANISHEIRTPMNGVIGMAELLACTPLSREQRAHVNAIQASGRSLLALLNDVLDFSRLESQRLTVEHEPFDVRRIVEDCVAIMTPIAVAKDLVLAHSIAAEVPPAFEGDQFRVRQVLLNLLSNALKFTQRGRVDVTLRSRPLGEGRIEIRFSVTDTGSGMAADDVERLFVPFQQLDGSTTRQHGGAGLGLAISKRLTELMGGRIEVETAPGRGSTFHFTIAGEAAALPAAPMPEPAERRAAESLRVLLAEDDAVNQVVVTGMLQHLGHHAHTVTNGLDALEVLERERYDVVLMDIQMPGLDGLEVTRRIRDSRGQQPYIIALTAHALSGDRERCLAAGMNDYLSKPLRLAELEEALADAAGRQLGHLAG